MRLILIGVVIALLAGGCRRECDCPVECGTGKAATAGAPAPGDETVAGATAEDGNADGAAADPAVPAPEPEYCASEAGEVFHLCSCRSVRRVKPEKLIRFRSRAEALSSGRRPCKHCRP